MPNAWINASSYHGLYTRGFSNGPQSGRATEDNEALDWKEIRREVAGGQGLWLYDFFRRFYFQVLSLNRNKVLEVSDIQYIELWWSIEDGEILIFLLFYFALILLADLALMLSGPVLVKLDRKKAKEKWQRISNIN